MLVFRRLEKELSIYTFCYRLLELKLLAVGQTQVYYFLPSKCRLLLAILSLVNNYFCESPKVHAKPSLGHSTEASLI